MRKILLFTLLLFLTISSFAQTRTPWNPDKFEEFFKPEAIPKDLMKEGHILVVETPYKAKETKKNDAIKKVFETYYKGQFVVVPYLTELKEYPDTTIYKYWFSLNHSAGSAWHLPYYIMFQDRSNPVIEKGITDPEVSTAKGRVEKMLIFIIDKMNQTKE